MDVDDKTLGQIAYEAAGGTSWATANQRKWEAAAQAVFQAIISRARMAIAHSDAAQVVSLTAE